MSVNQSVIQSGILQLSGVNWPIWSRSPMSSFCSVVCVFFFFFCPVVYCTMDVKSLVTCQTSWLKSTGEQHMVHNKKLPGEVTCNLALQLKPPKKKTSCTDRML